MKRQMYQNKKKYAPNKIWLYIDKSLRDIAVKIKS